MQTVMTMHSSFMYFPEYCFDFLHNLGHIQACCILNATREVPISLFRLATNRTLYPNSRFCSSAHHWFSTRKKTFSPFKLMDICSKWLVTALTFCMLRSISTGWLSVVDTWPILNFQNIMPPIVNASKIISRLVLLLYCKLALNLPKDDRKYMDMSVPNASGKRLNRICIRTSIFSVDRSPVANDW